MVKSQHAFTALIGITLFVTGCAHDGYGDGRHRYGTEGHQNYGQNYRSGNGYHGNHGYGERHANRFSGRGARKLDPWLSRTREGQQFVTDHYDVGPRGEISRRDAENANAFFRRWSDTDRNYRLTDAEIRTALIHTRNGYGFGRY